MSHGIDASAGTDPTLHVVRTARGRPVLLQGDRTLYAGRGYRIHRSCDDAATWDFVTTMPGSLVRGLAAASRLASRLVRYEVRAMGILSGGRLVASNREGVYFAVPGETVMRPSRVNDGRQPFAPPTNITVDPNDRIVWGEYDSRRAHGNPVRVFVSEDGGQSYEVAHVFEGGTIRHVHNVVYDAALRKYWVLAGDHDHEPGIGLLGSDLQDFEWIAKGEQQFRAVDVLDFGEALVYGTDSEIEPNAILRFDKKTARVERLVELEGSCLYSCRFGRICALTTTVEPSEVNTSPFATLWTSPDGDRWTKVYRARKDRWPPQHFQFGSLILPRGTSGRDTIFFGGRAVEGLDGRLAAATFKCESR